MEAYKRHQDPDHPFVFDQSCVVIGSRCKTLDIAMSDKAPLDCLEERQGHIQVRAEEFGRLIHLTITTLRSIVEKDANAHGAALRLGLCEYLRALHDHTRV